MSIKIITNEEMTNQRMDRRLALFIVGYFFVQAINLFVKLVVGDFAGWDLISKGIMVLLLLFALKSMIRRAWKQFFITEIVATLLFGYTLLFHFASFSAYLSIIINVLTVFIPIGIAAFSIQDKKILLNLFYKVSWPIQIILIYVLYTQSSFTYSMVGGYTLMFQALIVFDHFCGKYKLYDLIVFILDLGIVFIYGSRGPLLCACTMIILKILFNSRFLSAKKLGLLGVVVCIVGIVGALYEKIINLLIVITQYLGYSSRNLYVLLNGKITNTSGRDLIRDYYIEMIKNGPVTGYGIAGGWIAPGTYPHNIFLELFLSFGVIFGFVACVIIIYLSFSAIRTIDEENRRIAHIMFSYAISLLLSDTFLKCPMFFILIAIGFQSMAIKFTFGSK